MQLHMANTPSYNGTHKTCYQIFVLYETGVS
jgi:hypothetical protein